MARELFKIDFCKIVKFDCKCGRRYVNTSNCKQCTDSHEKQTNADRIRSMTDDELAEIIFSSCFDNIDYKNCHAEDTAENNCKKCALEWLQSESEEQHENMSIM